MFKSIATDLLNIGNRISIVRIVSRSLSVETTKFSVKAETVSAEDEVIIEEVNNKGIITLNRPEALNALNLPMIRAIYPALKDWENKMDLVIIRGNGEKAFCAGGDVKTLALALRKPDGSNVGKQFFREEYTLNHLIGTYKKPYIALIDGITMGGGVGLSVHGKYRVATEKTVFAMPETAIGFFPDVGGTYFLPQLKGKLGLFLGLTGHRLKATDVVHAGIATHYTTSDKLESLVAKLVEPGNTDIDAILNDNQTPVTEPFSLESHIEYINEIFEKSDIMDILLHLKESKSKWGNKILEHLNKLSPTALKLTFTALNKASNKTLAECLQTEYRLACSFMRRESDFYEGVRAVLIDKDQKPNWNPKHIGDVTDKYMQTHFSPLPEGEELQLS